MSSSTRSQILAGVVFIVSVVAFVLLELQGRPTDGLMVLVGPAVAALIINAHVTATTKDQNRQLSRLEEQTNGNLHRRDLKIDELTQELVEAKAQAAAAVAALAAAPPPADGA